MDHGFNNLYEFDDFRLNERERNLWRDGKLIPMPPKLFDTLLVLVKNAGNVVSKGEMLESVWADSFVEESNLSQNIYTLRQLLGREKAYIETVPRKGYRFVVPVRTDTENPEPASNVPADNAAASSPRTGRRYFGILAAAAILLIIVATTAFWLRSPGQPEGTNGSHVELTPLTDSGAAHEGTISADGKFAAYIDNGPNGQTLRLLDVNARSTVEIPVKGKAFPGTLVFSPDGSEIYFRDRGLWRTGRTIYRMPRFGGDPEPVAEDAWGGFAISPGGRQLAYFREDTATNTDQLIVFDINERTENVVVRLDPPEQFVMLVSPAWSADGSRIAFIKRPLSGRRSDISIVETSTGKTESVRTELSKLFDLAWLPDGKSLYVLSKEPDRNRQIWRVGYPDGKATRITNDLGQYEKLSVTKDGRHIISEVRTIVSNVWVMRPEDPNGAKQLTTGTYGHFALGNLTYATEDRIIYDAREDVHRDLWSAAITSGSHDRLTRNAGTRNSHTAATADGRYLYFSSNRDETESIWRMGQNGSEPVKLTSATDGTHWFPALSPDEKHLYYLSREKNISKINRILLDDGSIETIKEIRDFSPLHFFRVSPDGKYLAFVHRSNTAEEPDSDEHSNTPAQIRIGLLNLSDLSVKTVPIRASRGLIRFTNGGASFDYILGNSIMRKFLNDLEAGPVMVLALPNEKIFNFDWSLAGTHIAIARGQYGGDLVMLSVDTD